MGLRLTFRETGGFAPIFGGWGLDATLLSAELAAELRALVNASGIQQMTDRRLPAAADMRALSFTIRDDGREHNVRFDAGAIPRSLTPLLAFVRRHAVDLLPP
jgi:hypothetical protein